MAAQGNVKTVPTLEETVEQAIGGIADAVRIMDLMGRGQDARNLAVHGNNLAAVLRREREAVK